MALKSVVADLNEVDEAFRGEYKEQKVGEKTTYYLDVEDFGKHPGAVTLKTSLNKVDKDKKDLETQLAALNTKFGDLAADEGFTIDEWNRLKAGNKDTPEAIKTLQEQHAAAITALKEKHKADIAARDGTIGELDGYIDSSLINGGLKDALLDMGVNPDLLDGAVATLRPRVKVAKDDKGVRAAVVDTDIGEVSLVDFVKEWSADKGKPYIGKASGPDVEGGQRRRSGGTSGDFGGDRGSRTNAIKDKFPELR